MAHNGSSTLNSDVTHRFSHDNLHISLNDQFDSPQADAVIALLQHNHMNCKRIFIDVRQVHRPNPPAVDILKSSLLLNGFNKEQVIFKGKSGFAMAVSGNRVLIQQEKKHVCKGNCANCKCGHHKGGQHKHDHSHDDQHAHHEHKNHN